MQGKLNDSFGPKLANFLKGIHRILQFLCGVDEKLTKTATPKLNTIQIYLTEETKLFQLFYDELKTNI
jgi:hypothetical protein